MKFDSAVSVTCLREINSSLENAKRFSEMKTAFFSTILDDFWHTQIMAKKSNA